MVKIKTFVADARIEQFFSLLVEASLTLQLRDNEIAAAVGRMLGYNSAISPDASSDFELVETFRHNIEAGRDDYVTSDGAPEPTKQ